MKNELPSFRYHPDPQQTGSSRKKTLSVKPVASQVNITMWALFTLLKMLRKSALGALKTAQRPKSLMVPFKNVLTALIIKKRSRNWINERLDISLGKVDTSQATVETFALL
jgi:hypothetical protein